MLKKFEFEGSQVRTVAEPNGEVWFVGIDVCNILGYADSYAAVKKLDEDEKKLDRVLDGQGKQKDTLTVNEFGLYSLVLTSTKPDAKKLKRWVTHEVLPTLARTGKFSTEEAQQREIDLQQITKQLAEKKIFLKSKQSELKDLKTEIKDLEKQRDEIIVNYSQQKLNFNRQEE